MMGDDVTVASKPGKGSVFTKFIGGLAGERTCLASHGTSAAVFCKLGALGRCRFLTPYLTLRFIADSLPRLLSISY